MLEAQTESQIVQNELAEERHLRQKAEQDAKAWGHQNREWGF